MRHNVAHRKLGRVTEHRLALLRNQAIALLRHERIETTMPKAKELRPFVERLITIARRGVAAGEAIGKTLLARRLVLAELPDRDVVGKLFDTLAPRFAERPGGYTRILRVGFRRGDSAEVAHVELRGCAEEGEGRRRTHQAGGAADPRGQNRGLVEGAGRRPDQGRRSQIDDSAQGRRVLAFGKVKGQRSKVKVDKQVGKCTSNLLSHFAL
jgi:large subunit ribosomal protein L17